MKKKREYNRNKIPGITPVNLESGRVRFRVKFKNRYIGTFDKLVEAKRKRELAIA